MEVSFNQNPTYWRRFSIFPLRLFGYETICDRVARFRQINLGQVASHHDALEFSGGTAVLVTDLKRGQKVTVLQLPVEPNQNTGQTEDFQNEITPKLLSPHPEVAVTHE